MDVSDTSLFGFFQLLLTDELLQLMVEKEK